MSDAVPESALDAVVERVVWRSPDGGFTVVRLVPEGGGAVVTAAGYFALDVSPGEPLHVEGAFEEHPRFGRQLRVSVARPRPPTTAIGIRRYLSSGRIKGIGRKLASRLVHHFGEATLRVLEETPERVLEVPGVGRSRLEELRRVF